MPTTDKFVTLYRPNVSIVLPDETLNISNSDIVTISFIHNYDTMTYPIIRLRLYSDISVIQTICDNPDDIEVRGALFGMVYRMNDKNKSPVPVSGASELNFKLKGYIERKNIPTSKFDQYVLGIKRTTDMNSNVKVPIVQIIIKRRRADLGLAYNIGYNKTLATNLILNKKDYGVFKAYKDSLEKGR
jgi:hypothetical protein